jgi:hypothetical protein
METNEIQRGSVRQPTICQLEFADNLKALRTNTAEIPRAKRNKMQRHAKGPVDWGSPAGRTVVAGKDSYFWDVNPDG